MTRGRYGIDAPGMVRAFLLVGIGSGAAAGGIWKWAGNGLRPALSPASHRPLWATAAASLLSAVSAYGLGMGSYMLWGSLITKVRGRDALLDLVPWTGNEQVLDVGCGSGLLLVGAAHRLTTGHATGIDLWLTRDQSSNQKDAPLENAAAEGVRDRVSVETGDMRKLPFADASFDVVLSHWAVHNLEHQPDRAAALAEMTRVLRPGGAILLTDIACLPEYEAELRHLGLNDVRRVIASRPRAAIDKAISFGAFQPATILAHKPASTHPSR